MRKGASWQRRKILGLLPLRTHGNYYTLSTYLWEWPDAHQKRFSITKDIKEGPQWKKQVGRSHGRARIHTSDAMAHMQEGTHGSRGPSWGERGQKCTVSSQPGQLHQKKSTHHQWFWKSARGCLQKACRTQDCSWKVSWLSAESLEVERESNDICKLLKGKTYIQEYSAVQIYHSELKERWRFSQTNKQTKKQFIIIK